MSKIFNFVFLCAVVIAGVMYQDVLKNIWVQSFTRYFPCRVPISYSIGDFDERFGLEKEEFLDVLRDAEIVWEGTVKKDFFKYKEDGNLKINLIYDTRQESTLRLKETGIEVENSRSSYDSLKTEYESLTSLYNQTKKVLDSRIASFQIRKNAYDIEVDSVNKKGGANKQTYSRLSTEKDYLNREIESINQLQSNLNSQIVSINMLIKTLNGLAETLNLNVKQFNTIGSSLGGEFEEGTYSSDVNGQRIDIYQYENRSKLVRVLAHELGHALGLDHIEDSKAIMYRLNNGYNEKATATDIAQLKSLCGIPN